MAGQLIAERDHAGLNTALTFFPLEAKPVFSKLVCHPGFKKQKTNTGICVPPLKFDCSGWDLGFENFLKFSR